jgi:cytoskeletal protein RodZ
MGRMIGRFAAILLLWSLCGFGDLSTALAQTAPAVSDERSAQPSASQPESAQPASDTTAPADPTTASSDPSDKPSRSKLPDAPSASQAPATTEIAQQSKPAEESPSGTAAATIGNPNGNLASKPAGAAIAPSQQHRGRSLLVKTGLVVGAAIALGSVVALSQAGSGRPPGAH